MKNLFVKIVCRIKEVTKEDLNISYSFYYFITRSNLKAFWYTVIR